MTSAFPTQQPSPFSPVASAIEIPERRTHIPAHYARNPHPDPENTIVKDGGVPIPGKDGEPFTVAQVAPERRYAIQLDGNVIPPNDFREIYKQAHLEWYALQRQKNPDAKFDGDINLIPIPNPSHWVRWRVDPRDPTKLLQIGFDPDATAGAKPEHFVDGEGEEIAGARLEHLCNAYANPRLRGALTAAECAEVEAYLGVKANAGANDIAARLQTLTELKEDGTITVEVYAEKVAALVGAPPAEETTEEVPEEPEQEEEAPVVTEEKGFSSECSGGCGHVSTGKTQQHADFGRRAHERGCYACQNPTPEDSS